MCASCDSIKTHAQGLIAAAVQTLEELPHPDHQNTAPDEWDNFVHAMLMLSLLDHHGTALKSRDSSFTVLTAWRIWAGTVAHALKVPQ